MPLYGSMVVLWVYAERETMMDRFYRFFVFFTVVRNFYVLER